MEQIVKYLLSIKSIIHKINSSELIRKHVDLEENNHRTAFPVFLLMSIGIYYKDNKPAKGESGSLAESSVTSKILEISNLFLFVDY